MIAALVGTGVAGAVGVLVLWWAAACARGTFPRNRILGIRTTATLRSQDAWAAAHRAGAKGFGIAGWGIVLAAAIAAVFALLSHAVPAVPLALTVAFAWAIIWIIVGSAQGSRAAAAAGNGMH